MTKKPTLVEVHWIDSGAASRGGWQSKKRHRKDFKRQVFDVPTTTVGYVWGADEKALYLSMAYNSVYDYYMDAQAVYRPDIVEIVLLSPTEGALRIKDALIEDWIERNVN